MKKQSIVLLVILLLLGTLLRLNLFSYTGRDSLTYKRAVRELINKENPYSYTIHTYEKEKQDWDHGFSYFPALLYVMTPFYLLGELSNIDPAILWKIPVLFADLLIAYLIFREIVEKNRILAFVSASIWLFNPYIVLNANYTYLDPIAILFMLLAIIYSEKDDVLTGVFFTLSVLLKTFPIILLPLLFFRSNNKTNFILSSLIVASLVFLPFMNSFERFRTMILGSFFVHGDRVLQGRPFLYFLSFVTHIELIQIIPTKIYAMSSIVLGLLISTFGTITKKYDKYAIATLSFVGFYLLTPVLNRTYLIWFMPVLLIAAYRNLKPKLTYSLILGFYTFYYWYLYIWIDGFHITVPTF